MKILRRSSGVIYPTTGAKFLALFLDMGGKVPLTCTLYPRVNGDGCIYALPSQKGCVVGCTFCSVPHYFGNLSAQEISDIMLLLENNATDVDIKLTGRNKISFVKGGELFQNQSFDEILKIVIHQKLDLKISTVFPKGKIVDGNLESFFNFCETFTKERNINLQFSALSTSEEVRKEITKHPLLSLKEIGKLGEFFFKARNRKVTISFTATNDLLCNPDEVFTILHPSFFAIRIYPYKKNAKHLIPLDDAKCTKLEEKFRKLGYTIIPCHNEYERDMGYFDETNKNLQELSF